ncbi:hypothetical protein [Streptomyces griseocarneus]|uniref:hypothetical protein n=1 Tax=Streptomyces griseocarneus TaxID=51201 RepID=UPI00167EF92B|nr:hypothetical protein [Streptomyces griseocarneus]MBZ6473499.1 hypothetical protein [Streptomyces griseocarneus]GHG56594.1 ATP synthase protein I [Streptomyces griseocarneus]
MQSNDARTLLQCAVPTALAGVVAVVAGSVLAGGKGGIGAAVGTAVGGGIMAMGLFVLQRTAKSFPHLFQAMGLVLYVTQFLISAVVLAVFRDTSLFNTRAFAFALLAAVLVWTAAQTRAYMKAKIFYVDPDSADAKNSAPAGSPS